MAKERTTTPRSKRPRTEFEGPEILEPPNPLRRRTNGQNAYPEMQRPARGAYTNYQPPNARLGRNVPTYAASLPERECIYEREPSPTYQEPAPEVIIQPKESGFSTSQLMALKDLNESIRGPADQMLSRMSELIADKNQLREKLGSFDPTKEDWNDFHVQFRLAAAHYEWTPLVCYTQLGTRLIGAAKNLFIDAAPPDYETLVTMLKDKFAAKIRTQEYEAEFFSRKLKSDETTTKYMQSLESLARRAYPEMTPNQLTPFIKRQFLQGLTEIAMQEQLSYHTYPTLQELTMAASRYLLVRAGCAKEKPTSAAASLPPKGTTPKSPAKAAQAYVDPQDTARDIANAACQQMGGVMVQVVREKFAQMQAPTYAPPPVYTEPPMKTTKPRPAAYVKTPSICFCCGQMGHRVQNCPMNADKSYPYTEAEKEWLTKVKTDPKTAGPPPIKEYPLLIHATPTTNKQPTLN